MSQPSRRRSPPRGRRPLLILAAAILFGAGIYFGIELGKPPPRPDFSVREPAVREPAVREPAEPPPGLTEPTPPPADAGDPGAPAAPATGAVEVVRQPPAGSSGQPRISIVIDDLGRSVRDLDALASLGIPLTYSVLPFESQTPRVVAELRRRGAELLCHLPMEAKGDADPGPGALYLEMTPEELAAATRRALEAVPGAAGVNNHMGSAIAPEPEAMSVVMSVVAERGLYFLDSRTSADTLGYTLARRFGVPAGERQVFLDTERDPAFIREQFAALLEAASERGGAIAIAHPYPETLAILTAEVPEAIARGFRFVPASALMDG
jgi:polysaccharide deacetylase 2 family uncharacterized protein YibQ